MAEPDPAPDKPNATPGGYSLAFWQMVITAGQVVFLAIAGYVINGKLEKANTQAKENGDAQVKHAEAQLKKADPQIAKQEEVKTAITEVKDATRAIPQGIVEQKVIIEAKPAEAKAEPPGLDHP
jgi:hypothetical protein